MAKHWKDLSKKEREHLKVDGAVTTLGAFKRTAEAQKVMRDIAPRIEPCWTCKRIAEKLGLPV